MSQWSFVEEHEDLALAKKKAEKDLNKQKEKILEKLIDKEVVLEVVIPICGSPTYVGELSCTIKSVYEYQTELGDLDEYALKLVPSTWLDLNDIRIIKN